MKTYVYDKKHPGPLHEETKELLINRPRPITLDMICKATGVEKRWLAMFIAGQIHDPSVNRIEALNGYMKNLQRK